MNLLDWGQVTPEATIDGKNEYIYIYNHDLSTVDKISRTIRFILGRLSYYDNHLPSNPKHFVQIDIRGQNVSHEDCSLISGELHKRYGRPDYLKVSFLDA